MSKRFRRSQLALTRCQGVVPGIWVNWSSSAWRVRLTRTASRVWVWLVGSRYRRDRVVGSLDLENFLEKPEHERREVLMKFLRRFTDKELQQLASAEVDDREFSSDYPAVAEYFYSTRGPEGKPRRTGTIVFFVEGTLVKAFFTDKDQGLQLCVTAEGLYGALAALEEALEAETPPWRRVEAPRASDGNGKRNNR